MKSGPFHDFRSALDAHLANPGAADVPWNGAVELSDAAYAARSAGFSTEVNQALDEAATPTDDPIISGQLRYVRFLGDDAEFLDHGVDGLRIRRVLVADGFADIMDLGLRVEEAGDGLFVLRVTRHGERTLSTIAAAIQLFVPNELPEERAAALHARGFDFSGLSGVLNAEYGLRSIRRALWGSGFCVLTDQRIIGLIYDYRVPGHVNSQESAHMPFATLHQEDHSGSVLVFDMDPGIVDEYEVTKGLLQSRVPTVYLRGEASLALDTYRILDTNDRLIRPPKNAIADAIRACLTSTGRPPP